MEKNKKYIVVGIVFVIIAIIIILFFLFMNKKQSNNQRKENISSTTDTIDVAIDPDNGDEKIDWSLYPTKSYELKDSLTINEEGTYELSGTIKDGSITINSKGNVRLILNGVSIVNSKGPAIYVQSAEDVVIVMSNNSDNYLEDGKNYSGYDSEVIGTIYSKSDITFDGEGTLTVISNKEDAIVGKDDLKIINGNYDIISSDDGIRGKDSVYIKNGNFKIVSGGDSIKSTNATDVGKGFVLIENGTFDLNATLDGIQSETKLLIQNGNFTIKTGGGSINSSDKEYWGYWGESNTASNDSAKGIKAGDNLVIENGTFTIDSSDDTIHSNNYVGIKLGTFSLSSGDDGIHADKEIIIDGGTIDISKSYEGIEASTITINDGTIKIVSSDDGINVAGVNDASAMNRPGANKYSNSDNILTINGGDIHVDASGDGLDANGSIYMNGGTVVVNGPTNSGNGALDYDNEFVVKGGTLLAGGANGMAQSVSSNSTIYSIFIGFKSTYGKEDTIIILDSSNKKVISYQSNKNYSSLVIASPELKKGDYKIQINGEDYENFTISNIVTTIGFSNGMMGPGGGDRPNGGMSGDKPGGGKGNPNGGGMRP